MWSAVAPVWVMTPLPCRGLSEPIVPSSRIQWAQTRSAESSDQPAAPRSTFAVMVLHAKGVRAESMTIAMPLRNGVPFVGPRAIEGTPVIRIADEWLVVSG